MTARLSECHLPNICLLPPGAEISFIVCPVSVGFTSAPSVPRLPCLRLDGLVPSPLRGLRTVLPPVSAEFAFSFSSAFCTFNYVISQASFLLLYSL